ncbi:MAG TPA: hypothetical protein VNK26_01910 [Pyrinomonadaceae bacterium]|nr:hypothetical protein [Pyrinomonadaceae bacterium]
MPELSLPAASIPLISGTNSESIKPKRLIFGLNTLLFLYSFSAFLGISGDSVEWLLAGGAVFFGALLAAILEGKALVKSFILKVCLSFGFALAAFSVSGFVSSDTLLLFQQITNIFLLAAIIISCTATIYGIISLRLAR